MIPVFIILLAFSADRLSKLWATEFLAKHGTTEINSFLTIHSTYNRGIAFGLLQGIGPAIGWLSVIVVVGLFIYLTRVPKKMWLLRLGLAFIIGGAMGNLVDRVTAGEVLDFIQTPLRPGIFNVADMMIHVGLVISLIGLFFPRSPTKGEGEALELEEKPLEV